MDWSANRVVDLYSSSANFFTCRVSQLQCHVQMPRHRSLQCACTSGSFDGAGICHVVDAVTSRRWRHADVNAIIYCNLRFIRPTAADWSAIDSDCCETHVAFAPSLEVRRERFSCSLLIVRNSRCSIGTFVFRADALQDSVSAHLQLVNVK